MPNYKADMLTFSSLGAMSNMLVDSTDQDGLLFAAITDSTSFKIVMWRKNSTATIDNDLVFPANGPGRWHVLPVGEVNAKEVLTIVGDTLPGTIASEIDLIAQKKTNGDKILKGRFGGIFEDFSANNIAIYDDTLGSVTPASGMKMAVVNKVSGDELYVAKDDQWELLDIAGGDDTLFFTDINGVATFSQLPTGTTSTTVATGNHSHSLDDLSDVTITSPVSGHTLSYDGSNWINTVASGGGGDIIQFAANTLPDSPDSGKSICVLSKTSPSRELIYRWTGSAWVLISYTNILDYSPGSGALPAVTGDTPGQMFIDLLDSPPSLYVWNNTEWQQIYP
jgi:hypothetical protein